MGRTRRVHAIILHDDPNPLTWKQWGICWAVFVGLAVGLLVFSLVVLKVTGANREPTQEEYKKMWDAYPDTQEKYGDPLSKLPLDSKVIPPPALPPYHAPDPVVSMPSMAPPILGNKPKPDPEPEVEAPIRPSKKPFIELERRDWEKGGSR